MDSTDSERFCPMSGRLSTQEKCNRCRETYLPICEYFCLIVVGSRTFDDYGLLRERLDHLTEKKSDIYIVSGGAKGADRLAVRYAQSKGFPYVEFPVSAEDWDRLGKKAGYLRNRKMHEFASAFAERGCVLFWDGKSPGTKQHLKLSEEFHTPLRIVRFDRT